MSTGTMWSAPRARMSGAVCLLYLGSIEVLMIAVGCNDTIYTAAGIMANVLYLILALLFYGMFRPVNPWLSLVASLCGVLGCTNNLMQYATQDAFHIESIPFLALFVLLTGVLMIRSTFLPQIFGWLQVLSAIGWLSTRTPWGSRVIGRHDFDFLVQLLLGLWLVIKGVNLVRWKERANPAGSGLPAEA